MKQADKIALLDWEKFKEDIARATPVDKSMSAQDRENIVFTLNGTRWNG